MRGIFTGFDSAWGAGNPFSFRQNKEISGETGCGTKAQDAGDAATAGRSGHRQDCYGQDSLEPETTLYEYTHSHLLDWRFPKRKRNVLNS
jgi:hypothetical protein